MYEIREVFPTVKGPVLANVASLDDGRDYLAAHGTVHLYEVDEDNDAADAMVGRGMCQFVIERAK